MDNSGCESVACSVVYGNTITRVAFGIEVNNQNAAGYKGDGSGTRVTSNVITGAAKIADCPNCSQGRAIKLQACGTVDVPPRPVEDVSPLRGLVVSNNQAHDFGGKNQNNQLTFDGSGLDLICGIQDGVFIDNWIDGSDSAAQFGLQIRDGFLPSLPAGLSQKNIDNIFHHNFFRSGSLTLPCGDSLKNCADVHFEAGVPDQIGLTKTSPGDNDYRNVRVD
jgi:hypothetical protein